MSELFSFKLEPEDAVRLGFAPGAFACPMGVQKSYNSPRDGDWERWSIFRERVNNYPPKVDYIIVGLDDTYSKLKISKDLYRNDGKLRSNGKKVHKEIGNIRDLSQLENMMNRPCEDEVSTNPYDAIKTMLIYVIGQDITGNKPIPTNFSILDAILGHIRSGQKDHARLLYHWPVFFDHFRSNPNTLDRAVKGEPLWDVISEFVPKETIDAARKIKGFSFTWNDQGLSIAQYIKFLVFGLSCLPKGTQWPQNEKEARLFNKICSNHISTFNRYENGPEVALKSLFSKMKWLEWGREYGFDFYTADYFQFITDSIIRPTCPNANDEKVIKIIQTMFGYKNFLEPSYHWHRNLRSPSSGLRRNIPNIWPSPFETVSVPERIASGGLSIVSLHTRDSLRDEGDSQRHCVGHHDARCARGLTRVISIRKGNETLSTAAIYKGHNGLHFEQHRGFANADPCGDAHAAAAWFLEGINAGVIEFSRDWPNLETFDGGPPMETVRDHFAIYQPFMAKKYREGGFEVFERMCQTV